MVVVSTCHNCPFTHEAEYLSKTAAEIAVGRAVMGHVMNNPTHIVKVVMV